MKKRRRLTDREFWAAYRAYYARLREKAMIEWCREWCKRHGPLLKSGLGAGIPAPPTIR